MHQKKSEVQIGKESSGVSSDFNPTPFPPSIHHKLQSHNFQSTPRLNPNDSDTNHPIWIVNPITQQRLDDPIPKTNPHKRPLLTQTNPNHNTNSSSSNSLSKSPTMSNSLYQYPFYSTPSPFKSHYSFTFPNPKAAVAGLLSAAARWALKAHSRFVSAQQPSLAVGNKKVVKTKVAESHRTCPWSRLTFRRPPKRLLHHLRRIQIHLRLVLLLSLPVFYFLVSHPSHSFLLDFLAAFAFSSALLFSLNLAVPRLPSIRLFFSRTFPIKSRPPLPVFWSIGSRRKSEKRVDSGCWVQVYSNGDVYEGEFHKGKCSGSGVYYYYMSGRYEGDWVDGKYDGYGVETWARGSRYRGQYRQGLRNGFGVYRFYTGDVYAGEWSNGQSHGCGIHTCDDGSRFVGEFKWGVKHGLGHYHFRNGDSFAGEYFADKMHGFGMYRFANGHRYEGAWHEGKRQGLGMYTFRNGETQSGQWNNGILDVPSTQNTAYPVSPVAVYHSRVLNTVQEARRAAEIAYDVAKVDERVNRAVAAANRAANAARVAAVKAVQSQMH